MQLDGGGRNPTNKRQRHPVLLLLLVSRGANGQQHISHQSTRLQANLQTAEHRVSEQASGHAAGESERSALGWREARADRHSTGRNDQGALRHDSQRGADRSRARLRQDRRLSSPPVGRNRLVREEMPRHRLEHNHRRRAPRAGWNEWNVLNHHFIDGVCFGARQLVYRPVLVVHFVSDDIYVSLC